MKIRQKTKKTNIKQNNITQTYCHNNKLKIDKKKLSEYIELFASDLLDPLKEKYMFDIITSEKILNYFKFIKRPYENIEIIIN